MAANHQILRSTVYLTVSRIVGDLVYVVFYVLFSRAFGRVGVGLYAFVLEFSGTLFIVADYGLSQYLVREISRKKDQLPQYLGTFMVLKGFSMLVIFGVMVWLAPLFHLDQRGIWALLVIGLAQACYTFGELLRSAFAAHERLAEVAWADFLYKCGIAAFGISLLALHRPFEEVLWAFPISGTMYLLTLLIAVWTRLGRPVLRLDPVITKEALAGSFHFFLFGVCVDLYPSLTVILLKHFKGEAVCGVFAVPQKIMAVLVVMFMFYRMALFPNLSRLYHESREAHRELCSSAFKYLAMLVVPLALLLFLTADKIILSTFGAEFEPSIPVFKALCAYLLCIGLKYVLAAVLSSIDKQDKLVLAHGVGLVVHLTALLLVVPQWGALGAAVVLAASEGAVCLMAYRMAVVQLGGLPWRHILPRPLVAAAVVGLLVMLMKTLPIFIVFPVGVLTGLACLVLIGGIRKSDLRFVRNSLSWRRLEVTE